MIREIKFTLMNRSHKMQQTYSKIAGSTTLEFVFCAPLLVIFAYAAMEINERLEQRVMSAIEANNAAWEADPRATNGPATVNLQPVSDVSKLNILGTAVATDPDTKTIIAYSPNKLKADGYSLDIQHEQGAATTALARHRVLADIGINTNGAAHTFASWSAGAVNLVESVFYNSTLPLLPIYHVEKINLSWSLTPQGSGNLALNAMQDLATYQNYQASGSQIVDLSSDKYRLLSNQSRFLRRNSGYHEDHYHSQVLGGFVAGLANSDLNNFVEKCYFKFSNAMSSDCGEDNGYFDVVDRGHWFVSGLRASFYAYWMVGCISATFGYGACLIGNAGLPIHKDTAPPTNTTDAAVVAVTAALESEAKQALGNALKTGVNSAMTAIAPPIPAMPRIPTPSLPTSIGD
jgi:hypothetical protein